MTRCLTPLSTELAQKAAHTDRLYRQCLEGKGHVDSGQRVMRTLGGAELAYKICKLCQVPFTKTRHRSPYAPPELGKTW